jgi:hypothetical protein
MPLQVLKQLYSKCHLPLSMAALGFLLQEEGAGSNPVFGYPLGVVGLLCRHSPFPVYAGGSAIYHLMIDSHAMQ